jgi:succinyl-CoA synthetase beta subunit
VKIHEYQARELLDAYGIAVPQAILARTGQEAARAVRRFGGSAMVKGQVLTGGRGKAGAIRAVSSEQEGQAAADEILAMSVKGLPVQSVLVTEKVQIQEEYYAGITIDREAKSVVFILSAAGGMDIEEVARQSPEKIRRLAVNATFESEDGRLLPEWLAASFPDKSLAGQAAEIARSMSRLFREKDCSLVEINPLAVLTDNQLIAADAKIVFDDNAVSKHPEIEDLRNAEEYTADELEARKAGLSFVSLSGEVGCMVNGAGLAMATMDSIKLAGGRPANFLDVGGSSNPQKVLDAMRILLRNKDLKVILINIFGGITRCDDVAKGILMAREQLSISLPIIIRLIGTNEEQGRQMLRDAGLIVSREMTQAVDDAVQCTREGTNR